MRSNARICAFDIGNVLLDVNPARRDERVLSYGARGDYSVLPKDWTNDLRLGHMNEQQYLRSVSRALGITEEQVLDAEQVMLGEVDLGMVSLARSLSVAGVRVVALSNNQPIHWRYLRKIIPFDEIFAHVYLSHELHLAKPSQEIFEKVVASESMPSDKIFLIDDEEPIVRVAIESGWLDSIVHSNTASTAARVQSIYKANQ